MKAIFAILFSFLILSVQTVKFPQVKSGSVDQFLDCLLLDLILCFCLFHDASFLVYQIPKRALSDDLTTTSTILFIV